MPPPLRSTVGVTLSDPTLEYVSGVRNDNRNDSRWLVDVRLARPFRVGQDVVLTPSIDVLDLFDEASYTVFNPDLGIGVRVGPSDAARRDFGRRWQVGLRISFGGAATQK